jgi:hypothetical protein
VYCHKTSFPFDNLSVQETKETQRGHIAHLMGANQSPSYILDFRTGRETNTCYITSINNFLQVLVKFCAAVSEEILQNVKLYDKRQTTLDCSLRGANNDIFK